MKKKFEKSVVEYNFRLILFNMIIVFLFLLRSAGYFQPYFSISVDFIVMFGLALSIILIKVRSKVVFLITLIFWVFAGMLQLLHINVWAERTGIYAYQSLVFAMLLFVFESFGKYKKKE